MFCHLKVFLFLCIVGMVLVVNIIFFQNYQKFRSNIFFIMNNTPGNAQRQGAEPRRASTLNAISNPKPHFHCKHSNFWFAFGIYKPKEPSLWFVVYVVLLEISHATALTTGAKRWHRLKAVFYVFVFDSTQ